LFRKVVEEKGRARAILPVNRQIVFVRFLFSVAAVIPAVAPDTFLVAIHRVKSGAHGLPGSEVAIVVGLLNLYADYAGLFPVALADHDGNYVIGLADAFLERYRAYGSPSRTRRSKTTSPPSTFLR